MLGLTKKKFTKRRCSSYTSIRVISVQQTKIIWKWIPNRICSFLLLYRALDLNLSCHPVVELEYCSRQPAPVLMR